MKTDQEKLEWLYKQWRALELWEYFVVVALRHEEGGLNNPHLRAFINDLYTKYGGPE
jgi:hypothetical protein